MSDFTETEVVSPVTDDLVQKNFMGIKIGDVNEDIDLGLQAGIMEIRSEETYSFSTGNKLVKAGDEIKIPVMTNQSMNMEGMQLGLDISQFKWVGLEGNIVPIETENYFVTTDGKLRIIWTNAKSISIKEREILFTITLVPKVSAPLSELLSFDRSTLQPEVYDGGNAIPIIFHHQEAAYTQSISQLTNIRIEPNPFREETTIRFELSNKSPVKVLLFNTSGQKIYEYEGEFLEGKQSLTLDHNTLPAGESVLYCQIIHAGNVFVEKLIRVK
jgi:hypothetical protein